MRHFKEKSETIWRDSEETYKNIGETCIFVSTPCFGLLPLIFLWKKFGADSYSIKHGVDPCFHVYPVFRSFPHALLHVFARNLDSLSFPYSHELTVSNGYKYIIIERRIRLFAYFWIHVHGKNYKKFKEVDCKSSLRTYNFH